MRKSAGSLDLKLRLRQELDGRGKPPTSDTVAKLNDLIAKVSKSLVLSVVVVSLVHDALSDIVTMFGNRVRQKVTSSDL